MTRNEAVEELRRFQRHHLLRQYGEDGNVLPENLRVSEAIDAVMKALRLDGPPRPSSPPDHTPVA